MADRMMKAALLRAPGKIEVVEIPVIKPTPGEVLIKVRACGICGSDLHIYRDEHPYYPPVIMGHELFGEIVQQVRKLRDGNPVIAWFQKSALNPVVSVVFARSGNQQVCPHKTATGHQH